MIQNSTLTVRPLQGEPAVVRTCATPGADISESRRWPDERDITLRDYLRIARTHAVMIIVGTLVATSLVATLLLIRPDYYEGEAKVQIDLEGATVPSGDPEIRVAAAGDPEYFSTQLQIMQSPMVLQPVIKDLDLEHNETYKRHMRAGGRLIRKVMTLTFLAKQDPSIRGEAADPALATALDPAITPDQLREAKALEPFVHDLQNRLTVEPVKEPSSAVKETRLVKVKVKHPSPMLAAKISNAIADSLVRSNLNTKEQIGVATKAYLTRRISDLQLDIRKNEQRLAAYGAKNHILSLEPSQDTTVDRLLVLNRQLVEAENARKQAQADYEQARTAEASSALADKSTPEIPATESKLADLRQRKAQLLAGATEQYPEVREVNEQITSLQRSLEDMRTHAGSVVVTNLKTKYQQELSHEESIRAALESQRRATRVQNQAAVEYRLLSQNIDTEKNLVNTYLKRLGESDVAQASIRNNIRVVEYATAPALSQIAGPWRLLWIALVFLLSLGVMTGLAFFVEHLDDTLRSSTDVQQFLQLPALAVIPAAGKLKAAGTPMVSTLLAPATSAKASLLSDGTHHPTLVENYRRLRTAVLSFTTGRPQVMVVTSSLAGEGKTTTTANLGISFAQTGASVLLIDGDMHHKKLTSLFNMKEHPGLLELLTNTRELTDGEIRDSICKHAGTGVCVLPAGNHVPPSAEMLQSRQLERILTALQPHFAQILIDSPAVAACVDTVILAKAAGNVLLVVEGGKTSRDVAGCSLELLEQSGARILGAVLNKKIPRSYFDHDYVYASGYDSVPTPIDTRSQR